MKGSVEDCWVILFLIIFRVSSKTQTAVLMSVKYVKTVHNCWSDCCYVQKSRSGLSMNRVSVDAQMDVFTFAKYVRNVQIVRCDYR